MIEEEVRGTTGHQRPTGLRCFPLCILDTPARTRTRTGAAVRGILDHNTKRQTNVIDRANIQI